LGYPRPSSQIRSIPIPKTTAKTDIATRAAETVIRRGEGIQAFVVMDWKNGKIVGLEVLDASKLLHRDLPAEAG
jgi:hypothetical protein